MSDEAEQKGNNIASDSDDDRPILELIKKRKAAQQAENAKKVKTEPSSSSKAKPKVKDEPKAKAKKEKDTPARETKSSRSGSSTGIARNSSDFYETSKGRMVQMLLCRWWYALTWPKPEEIGTAPEGYEPLDGFPGVFISTSSDSLGTILDLRNKSNCPNLKNISSWTSAKIQETLVEALTKQMEVLKEKEGDDNSTYKQLKANLKEVRAINTTKADQEAKKFVF